MILSVMSVGLCSAVQPRPGVSVGKLYGQDDVVPLDAADTSRARLTSLGYGVDCKTYPMAHTVCTAEIDDIREFIERALA